jgi:diguanylate cyclase (GGDEF)-like protein
LVLIQARSSSSPPRSGAYRRDAFLDVLEREIVVSARRGVPLSMFMMDIDDFKAVNDTHGHLVGDKVIADFASRAASCLRAGDVVGRYGGEEFVVLLPRTDIEAALPVAERIRASIADPDVGDVPRYTVSIGVAGLAADRRSMAALLDAADKALYSAKRAGKNQVVAMGQT